LLWPAAHAPVDYIPAMPYRVPPGHDERLELPVRTESLTPAGLRAGAFAWLAWALLLALVVALSGTLARVDHGELTGFVLSLATLALLGFVPALVATHLVSRRTQNRVLVERGRLSAGGEIVVDLAERLDACVVELEGECALLLAQKSAWVILFGRDLGAALGGPDAWGPRWHRVRLDRLSHRAGELGPGRAWPAYFSVRGPGRARIVGEVEAGPALESLADRARELAQRSGGALLALPTAHPEHSALRVDSDGVLNAFGERIDTRRSFERSYVWSFGKKNARGDADAIVLQQDDAGLCLSVSARPGGFPSIGGFPPAAPELPTPEMPREQVLSPVAVGALDGLLAEQSVAGVGR